MSLGFTLLDVDDNVTNDYSSLLMNEMPNNTDILSLRQTIFKYNDLLVCEENCSSNDDSDIDEENKEIQDVLQKGIDKLKANTQEFLDLQSKKSLLVTEQNTIKHAFSRLDQCLFDIQKLDIDISNIKTDLQVQKTQKLKTTEEQIKELDQKLNNRSKTIKKQTLAFGLTTNLCKACPICFSREISHYVYSCGHTYCGTCITKITDKCFICNKLITGVHQLYCL